MLLHKVISVGNSKAVIIPAQFFEYWIKQGKEINEVGIEIDGEIIIRPIFKDINQSKNVLSEIKDHIEKNDQKIMFSRRDHQ